MFRKLTQKNSTIGKLILITLFFYLPILTAQLFLKKAGSSDNTFIVLYFSLSTILINVLLISYAVKRKKVESFMIQKDLKQLRLSFLPIAFVSTLALFFVVDPLDQILPSSRIHLNYLEQLMQLKTYSFLVIVVIVPILEEILFRGIILRNLLHKFSPFRAIAISAFFFAAIHFNLAQLVTGFIGGSFLGYIFWQTQSLLACISVHIIYNALSFFSYHTLRTDFSIESAIDNTPVYLILYLAAALTLAFSILFIYKTNYTKHINSGNL
jgi:hypothetical protein